MVNQYLLEKTIGSGSFAKVKLCRDKNKNIKYAMKVMKKKILKSKLQPDGKSAYDCVKEEL